MGSEAKVGGNRPPRHWFVQEGKIAAPPRRECGGLVTDEKNPHLACLSPESSHLLGRPRHLSSVKHLCQYRSAV